MTLLLFVLILSLLVLVHELGHFLAAKKAGIKVEEFAFGLPFTKPLFSRKMGETVYSIYPMFFGGFVKLYGEDGSAEMTNDQILNSKQSQNSKFKIQNTGSAYFEKSIPRRLSVLLAGVTMNVLLGIVCFSILYYVWGVPAKTGNVLVEAITKNSPAETAGLKQGDLILGVDGKAIKESKELINIAQEKTGKKIELEVKRENGNPCEVLGGGPVGREEPGEKEGQKGQDLKNNFKCRGKNLLLYLVPREKPPEGEGPLGVVISDTEFKHYPWYQMPFLGALEGIKDSLSWGKMILVSLKTMMGSLILQGRIPKEIAGPIGIYQITGQASKAGWLAVLQLIGIISVNLAIVNVLPIPAMDGGRVVFLFYELVARKKAPPKVEGLVNQIGMFILLALMALITINDVIRLINK